MFGDPALVAMEMVLACPMVLDVEVGDGSPPEPMMDPARAGASLCSASTCDWFMTPEALIMAELLRRLVLTLERLKVVEDDGDSCASSREDDERLRELLWALSAQGSPSSW